MFSFLIILLSMSLAFPMAEASSLNSGGVTQSYSADPSVLPSMLVESQSKDNKSTVIPLSSDSVGSMTGVVVPSNNATIVLTPQTTSSQQVIVAASGLYNVLVSNQNGSIKTGDYLSVSALPGIAMKADSNQSLIIGRAASSFNGDNSISVTSLNSAQNKAVNVAIGRVAVNVQLAPNPLYLKNSNSILVFLTRAEYNITNKQVGSTRTYLSAFVLLVTIIVSGVLLYSGTRNSMIAIGRNPLAKSAISKGLIKTIIAGITVFTIGVAIVYLILNQ
jgi:hypothetical protein